MCHPAGVRDYPPPDSLCPPNLRNFLYWRLLIKQSSCLFIWSLNPDIINTGAQLSQAWVHVSKLLVTTLFVEILHGMDFGVVRWRSPESCVSDTHKYTYKWYFLKTPVCCHQHLPAFNLVAISFISVWIMLSLEVWLEFLCGAAHGPD